MISNNEKDLYMYNTCANCSRKIMCDTVAPENKCSAYKKLCVLIEDFNKIEEELDVYTKTCEKLSIEIKEITSAIEESHEKNS